MIRPKLPLKVGILGSGQLARMMALAAHGLGVRPFIFADRLTDSACQVAADITLSTSANALEIFLNKVDIVTIENEFLDLKILQTALKKAGKDIFPSIKTLSRLQSKLDQKESLKAHGLPALDFITINAREDLAKAWTLFKGQLVLKTARFGYDGKGTFLFAKNKKKFSQFTRSFIAGSEETWGYAEPLAPYKLELAVMVARNIKGETLAYPATETFQEGGICQWSVTPARVPATVAKRAEAIAKDVVNSVDGVGVFGVEMFYLGGQKLVINEIAPRVHNSGHWTLNGAPVNQFEQHLRAGLGLPLTGVAPYYSHIAMVNIIGKGNTILDGSGVGVGELDSKNPHWVYWYGKSGKTFGRKLGHVNASGKTPGEALALAQKARKKISV